MSELKVFVYGTLKVGGKFAATYDKVRKSVKVGKIKGILYNLGFYPGVKLGGDSVVIGEVHTYTNKEEVEKSLDRLEGYYGTGNKSNLYNKETVKVSTDDGDEDCLVYEYNNFIDNNRIIPEGVWKV